MKTARLTLLVLFLLGSSSFAGEIYGTIKLGDQLAKGASVEVKIGDKTYPGVADEFGNYRVVVAETGICQLTIHFKDQSLKDQSVVSEAQSYWNPTRFDWVVEKSGDNYSMKRK